MSRLKFRFIKKGIYLRESLTKEEIQKQIEKYKSVDPEWRREIANVTEIPELLDMFADDTEPRVRAAAAYNHHWRVGEPVLKLETALKLAKDPVPEVREYLAMNHSITYPKVFEILAKDEDPDVRHLVARNPNTPDYILIKLAKDPDYWTRVVVAQRAASKSLPWKAREILLEDPDDRVREQLFISLRKANKDDPDEDEVLKMFKVGSIDFKIYIAKETDKSDALEIMSKHSDWRIREAVAKNRNFKTLDFPVVGITIQKRLARDKSPEVRRALASNSQVDIEILFDLMQNDPDPEVRKLAKENIKSR